MAERERTPQELLEVAPISDILLPFEEARARLAVDPPNHPNGITMREEELRTLFEEDGLKTQPFQDVMTDFLMVVAPRTIDQASRGIQVEWQGKVFPNTRIYRDPGVSIAGYLIDFTRIVDPQKVPFKEIVGAIAQAADILNANNVELLERVHTDWHYLLGRSFGAAMSRPDAFMNPDEARKFCYAYLGSLPKTEQGARAGDTFSKGVVGAADLVNSRIIP